MSLKMPTNRLPPRVDTSELKAEIKNKVGSLNAEKYFNLLNSFFSCKIGKNEFNRVCIGVLGRENVCLHNRFIKAILKNACLSEMPPSGARKLEASLNVGVANGCQMSSLQSLCRDVFPQSPRKGRTPTFRDRKFKDRHSPLGPHGKLHNLGYGDSSTKMQSPTELLSVGGRPPVEVNSEEDGEVVEQVGSSGVHTRSPLIAPLGILFNAKRPRKLLSNASTSAYHIETCHNSGELPDTSSLHFRLEKKLGMEGFKVSVDFINLLNSGMDVFLKRLVTPCMKIASSRLKQKQLNHGHGESTCSLNEMRPMTYLHSRTGPVSTSMLDFQVAMELNPKILGEDWPKQLEKICLCTSLD